MKYFIIAGEQSGDLHGSNLVRGLYAGDPSAEITCWGGDLMESAGARLLMHYKHTAFMGFVAVLKNLGTIKRNLELCKNHIVEANPDVVIFIDYPGFNMRIAEFAKKAGYRTFYYISPKFWAWNEGRVRKVKQYVDRMFIIFPFEIPFYARHGIKVEYYGNPLVDEMERKKAAFPSRQEIRSSLGLNGERVVALLAGSRKTEIEHVLPCMLKMVDHFPSYTFLLAGVKNIPDGYYSGLIGSKPVRLVKEKTYELLYIADAALVTSGTATLETALTGTPEVVCYKGPFLEMLIAWFVVKVKYISLVNLIMGSEVVRELVQYDLTEKKIFEELGSILPGGEKREKMLSDYKALAAKLGPAGASLRVAAEMIKELNPVTDVQKTDPASSD
jgi:lipid-A-disaccharide synthase